MASASPLSPGAPASGNAPYAPHNTHPAAPGLSTQSINAMPAGTAPASTQLANSPPQNCVMVNTVYSTLPSVEDQRARAWKYEGYPAFTEWIDSTDDFFLIRRFGVMNARVILLMQDRLAQKEHELFKLDQNVKLSSEARARNDSFRWDVNSKREKLLDQIKDILKEYNEFISTYSEIKARSSAPDYQIRNVKQWFENHQEAVRKDKDEKRGHPGYENEQEYIEKTGDLISLVPKARTPMRWLLQRSQRLQLWAVFKAKRRAVNTQNPSTRLISERGFEWFTSGLIISGGLILLFAPIWWLHFVVDEIKRLSIITGFVALFTVLCALSTVPRPFEVLAATAAYSAVLLVYLQIGSGSP